MEAKDTEKSFEERWIEDESYALGKKAGEKSGIRKAIDNLKRHYCIVDVEARIKEIEAGD